MDIKHRYLRYSQNKRKDWLIIFLDILDTKLVLNLVRLGGLIFFILVGIYILLAINGYLPILNKSPRESNNKRAPQSTADLTTFSSGPFILQRTGVLHVRSIPPNVDLYLDSRHIGKAGNRIIGRVFPNVPVGTYTLTAKRAGYFDYVRAITIEPEAVVNLSIYMIRKPQWQEVKEFSANYESTPTPNESRPSQVNVTDLPSTEVPKDNNAARIFYTGQNRNYIIIAARRGNSIEINQIYIKQHIPGRLFPYVVVHSIRIPSVSNFSVLYNRVGVSAFLLSSQDKSDGLILFLTHENIYLMKYSDVVELGASINQNILDLLKKANGVFIKKKQDTVLINIKDEANNLFSVLSNEIAHFIQVETTPKIDIEFIAPKQVVSWSFKDVVPTVFNDEVYVLATNGLSDQSVFIQFYKPNFVHISLQNLQDDYIKDLLSITHQKIDNTPGPSHLLRTSSPESKDNNIQLYLHKLDIGIASDHKGIKDVTLIFISRLDTSLTSSQLEGASFTILKTSLLSKPKIIALNTSEHTLLLGDLIPNDQDYEVNTTNQLNTPFKGIQIQYFENNEVIELPIKCRDIDSVVVSNNTIYCLDDNNVMHLIRFNRVVGDILHPLDHLQLCHGKPVGKYWHIFVDYLITLDESEILICPSWNTGPIRIQRQSKLKYLLTDTILWRLNQTDNTLEYTNLFLH